MWRHSRVIKELSLSRSTEPTVTYKGGKMYYLFALYYTQTNYYCIIEQILFFYICKIIDITKKFRVELFTLNWYAFYDNNTKWWRSNFLSKIAIKFIPYFYHGMNKEQTNFIYLPYICYKWGTYVYQHSNNLYYLLLICNKKFASPQSV